MLNLKAYLASFELFDGAELNLNYSSMIRDACRLLRVDEAFHVVMNMPLIGTQDIQTSSKGYLHILCSAVGEYKCVTSQMANFNLQLDETRAEFTNHFLCTNSDLVALNQQSVITDLVSNEGELGESSIIVVATRRSEAQWKIIKQRHGLEMRSIGEFFHHHLISNVLPKVDDKKPEFTSRELEVLRFSAQGKTYIEIAAILNISSRTVRFFLENIRQKLGCHNTTHAVAIALQRGII
jgi:DNA-binding CsgD family transcriptional regulator